MRDERGDVVADFVEPVVRLGCKPKAGDDLAAIATYIARTKPAATAHQLRCAVDRVAKTWRYKTFPPVAICLQAIEASPLREVVEAPRAVAVERGEAPIVRRCRAYVEEFEAAGEAQRARLEKQWPGRYESSTSILRLYAA